MSRYLGIDYGAKRIGIAVSDPGMSIAFARDYVANDGKLFERISSLIKEDEISRIIIGMPVSLSGEATVQTRETEEFARKLRSFLEGRDQNPEFDFIDERLTSRMAQSEVLQTVPRKSRRREKGLVDEISARIILQNYLDREKNLRT